ncbi:MAG: hypothetical protein EA355_14275 [Rhodobacteraceae bacterium]|nr:MAG: hypothetical protein EA355_14275 [Paracoccaceae bacterium]
MTLFTRIEAWGGEIAAAARRIAETPIAGPKHPARRRPMPAEHQIDRLHRMLGAPPTGRSARLLAAPTDTKARRLIEEAAGLAFHATEDRRSRMVADSADLLFHLVALWRDRGIEPHEVWTEMARRAWRLGVAEKAVEPAPQRRARTGDGSRPLYRRGDTIGPAPLSAVAGR